MQIMSGTRPLATLTLGHENHHQLDFVLTSIDEREVEEEEVVAAVIAVVLVAEDEGGGGSSSRKALLLAARTRSSTKAAERSLGRGGCCMRVVE